MLSVGRDELGRNSNLISAIVFGPWLKAVYRKKALDANEIQQT